MKKQLHRLLLVFVAVLFAASGYAYDVVVDGIYYDLNETERTASVTCRASYEASYAGSVSIPASITCEGTTYSVTSIGGFAFSDCTGLTSVTIPNSVTSIASTAFRGCTRLKFVNVESDNPTYSSVGGVVYSEDKTTLALCPGGKEGAFTIPESVTSIGDYAFSDCTGLTSVTIPNSVTSIGNYTFYGCAGLTSITIPYSVKSIIPGAFYGCTTSCTLFVYPSLYKYCKSQVPDSNNPIVRVMGAPVYLLSYPKKTQTTMDFTLRTSDYVPVPDGWEEISVVEKGIYFNGIYYPSESDDHFLFTGLTPARTYAAYSYVKYSDGFVFQGDQIGYGTDGLNPQLTVVASPTAVTLTGSYTVGDAHVSETGFTDYGTGNTVTLTGLKPGATHTFTYYVKTEEGSNETVIRNVATPDLELETLQPRGVSSTCAIVAATTNISEEETNVGFQWKKYDAPETLKPSEGYAAIYDGQLEGYIKNLQPTSYYNVRAFYKSADGTYYYGDWVTFDPSDFSFFEPTVHTYPAQEVSHDYVRVKGYVMAGTDEITEQGFEYWPLGTSASQVRRALAATTAAAADNVTTVLATGQVMSAVIEGLAPSTTYCYRAFVRTASGTAYGEEQTFTTEADLTAIGGVEAEAAAPTVVGWYDLNGRRLAAPAKGVHIVRYSDSSTRKVVVK